MQPVKGHLEILDRGFGFLRDIDANFRPSDIDTFVPAFIIRKYNLPEGVLIEGAGEKGDGRNKNQKMAKIDTINGMSYDEFKRIKPFQQQTSIHPEVRLRMSRGNEDIMGRLLDMIVPVGRGQRGMIVSPPKSGKTTILKHMAKSISGNYADVDTFVLLVDERPEEVTDFKRGLKGVHVLSSSADQSVMHHMRIIRLTMNAAMRCAESGRDTVVFIDSLTRMARAFNREADSRGRTLTGGLGANAMEIPRKIFGAARNIEDGGSLTILATILVDTGSRMDDIIFQEFKGTGNMDLVLSRKCAEKRIWPAIHINQSGTRNEALLLGEEEYRGILRYRKALSRLDETDAISYLIEHIDVN